MVNEIMFSAAITCFKPSVMTTAVGRAAALVIANMAGNFYVEGSISVATSATLIPLGQVVAPHWAFFKNMDVTNFVRLMNGSGGAKLPKLLPGEAAFFPLDDTSVPYAIADTAACLLEYLIFSL